MWNGCIIGPERNGTERYIPVKVGVRYAECPPNAVSSSLDFLDLIFDIIVLGECF